jgi:N-acetylneuraminic acid mutarotase
VLDTSQTPFTWTQAEFSGSVPSPRACHTITCVPEQQRAYCWGGYSGSRCYDQMDVLDLATGVWMTPKVNGTPPSARNAQTATYICSGKIVVFGGHSGARHLKDLHVFDTTTLSWSEPLTKGPAPQGLRGHTATLLGSGGNDKLYIFGGYDGR